MGSTVKQENGLGCGRRHLTLVLTIAAVIVGSMVAAWSIAMSNVDKRVDEYAVRQTGIINDHEARMRALESQGTRSEIKLDYLIIKVDAITATLINREKP